MAQMKIYNVTTGQYDLLDLGGSALPTGGNDGQVLGLVGGVPDWIDQTGGAANTDYGLITGSATATADYGGIA